jgi:hypothetical protein
VGIDDGAAVVSQECRKMPVPLKVLLVNFAAMVALWAPVYLALLDRFGSAHLARSEPFQWMLVAVGAMGLASILHAAWKDTRDPAWRSSHGLRHHPSAPARR